MDIVGAKTAIARKTKGSREQRRQVMGQRQRTRAGKL